MPYIQKITITKPFPEQRHFYDKEYAIGYSSLIKYLRAKYADRILSHTVSGEDQIVTRAVTVWASKEDHDNFNRELRSAFPNYRELRDEFNREHEVEFVLEYEETS